MHPVAAAAAAPYVRPAASHHRCGSPWNLDEDDGDSSISSGGTTSKRGRHIPQTSAATRGVIHRTWTGIFFGVILILAVVGCLLAPRRAAPPAGFKVPAVTEIPKTKSAATRASDTVRVFEAKPPLLQESIQGQSAAASSAEILWSLSSPGGEEDDETSACSLVHGNAGFSERVDLCKDDSTPGGLSCLWNPTLAEPVCVARHVVVNRNAIGVSAGGQSMATVALRNVNKSNIEMPRYQPGAFEITKGDCRLLSQLFKDDVDAVELALIEDRRNFLPNHMYGLIQSINTTIRKCHSWEERPTLFLTRYEYANLYHTYTEWHNAFHAALVALMMAQNSSSNKAAATTTDELLDSVDLVLLDGHARGALDPGWHILFPKASIRFVSELQPTTCFRRAVFVPPGYCSPLSVSSFTCGHLHALTTMPLLRETCQVHTAWLRQFQERFGQGAESFLQQENPAVLPRSSVDPVEIIDNGKNNGRVIRVVFISRQDYKPHPKASGRVTRKIANERALMDEMVSQNYALEIRRIQLEQLHVATQITTVRNHADIVVGMHGAGLSHVFMARPGSVLIELMPASHATSASLHFLLLAQLAGCHYLRNIDPFFPKLTEDGDEDVYEVPLPIFRDLFQTAVELVMRGGGGA